MKLIKTVLVMVSFLFGFSAVAHANTHTGLTSGNNHIYLADMHGSVDSMDSQNSHSDSMSSQSNSDTDTDSQEATQQPAPSSSDHDDPSNY